VVRTGWTVLSTKAVRPGSAGLNSCHTSRYGVLTVRDAVDVLFGGAAIRSGGQSRSGIAETVMPRARRVMRE